MMHLLLTLACCSSSAAALALRHRSGHQSDDTVNIPTVLSGNVQHAVFLTHFGVNEQQVFGRNVEHLEHILEQHPVVQPLKTLLLKSLIQFLDLRYGEWHTHDSAQRPPLA